MAGYTVIEDWQSVEAGYVLDVTIRKTEDDKYPSGWDYSLHLGEVGGDTVLRYDNAHERTKGHERHTRGEVEYIDFPGMWNSTTDSRPKPRKRQPMSGVGKIGVDHHGGDIYHAQTQNHRRRT
nr:DUF6516 family protein [Halorussus sp. DT72]